MAVCEAFRTQHTPQQIPQNVVRPITETMRLIKALRELAGDDHALKDWLVSPNKAFGNKQPLKLIKNGQADLLWEMIHQLRQGQSAHPDNLKIFLGQG